MTELCGMKMSTAFATVAACAALLTGCADKAQQTSSAGTTVPAVPADTATAHPPVLRKGNFTLAHFSPLPKEIDGCSCYFSGTEADFKSGKYLFAADYNGTAFIQVDGKMQKLDLTESIPTQGVVERRRDRYSNEDFRLSIDIVYDKISGDETSWYKGTISVQRPDSTGTELPFVGECGC